MFYLLFGCRMKLALNFDFEEKLDHLGKVEVLLNSARIIVDLI